MPLIRFLPPVTLILGGARSGKSAHAEALVERSGLRWVYVATAQPLDVEMSARIEHHRRRRGAAWRTLEEPLALPELLAAEADPGSALLVDCLTLWLTNLMVAGRDVEAACEALEGALAAIGGPVVLVSNEVGQGVVPIDAMSRAFVDHAGRLHQRLAALADRVQLVTAGLALDLKHPQRSA
jgi:adenosylcobinamide kinase/adenosylcobinamide-phosphate guanylyltransferase